MSSQTTDDVDELFAAMSNGTRRFVLRYVLGRQQQVTVTQLSHALVGWRTTAAGDPGETTVQRERISLTHVHLPMLAESDLVQYDPDRAVVEPHTAAPGYEVLHALGRTTPAAGTECRPVS